MKNILNYFANIESIQNPITEDSIMIDVAVLLLALIAIITCLLIIVKRKKK